MVSFDDGHIEEKNDGRTEQHLGSPIDRTPAEPPATHELQVFDDPVFSFDELGRKAQQKALKDAKRTLIEAISDDEALEEFLRKLHSRFRENGDLFELVYFVRRKTETEEDQQRDPSWTEGFEQTEKDLILKVLNHVHWRLGKACQALGISRPTLRLKMKRYGIDDSHGI